MPRPRLAALLLLLPFIATACDSDSTRTDEPFGFTEVTLAVTDERGNTRTFTEVVGDGEEGPTIEVIPDASYTVAVSFRNADAEDPGSPQKAIESDPDLYQVIYEVTGDAARAVAVRYADTESDYDVQEVGEDEAVGLAIVLEGGTPAATVMGFLDVELYEYEPGTKRTGVPGLSDSGTARFSVVVPIL